MADRCSVCHTEIAGQMRDVATVHGSVMHNNPGLGCRHCHPEHRGPEARLTVMDDATFPHEVLGFSLGGHQQTSARETFQCDDCHRGDITTLAPEVCETCHRQLDVSFMTAHTLSFGSACLDCHDGVDRFDENFNHNDFTFQLTGRHVSVACVQCHINARGYGDFPVTLQDCYACHHNDEAHEGRFGVDCSQCHTTEGWAPAKFDHNLSAFKLEGKHAQVACEACHIDRQYQGTAAGCASCHQQDDEHNGQYGTDCAACHNPSNWKDADFDHNLSSFPLTGAHVGLACESCHSSGQFAELASDCASCHDDPPFHAGLFGLNCASCHTTDNWFTHYNGPHPGIADEGGSGVNHGGASCQDCHTQTLHAATCTACHESNDPDDDGGDNSGHGGGED
jgi:hypothetical protein